MPRCSCAGNSCSCSIQSGSGILVTGTGNASSPFIISLSGLVTGFAMSAAGVLDLSLTDSDALIEVPLDEDVSSLVLPSGGPTRINLAFRNTGDANTVTWPSEVKWAGGTAPTLSTNPGDIDWVSLRRLGDVWLGVVEGAAFH